MKRVVITGIGIISSIGNNKNEVLKSLKLGQSGVVLLNEMRLAGMRSHVCGKVFLNDTIDLDRKIIRFMNQSSIYAYSAVMQAIKDSLMTQNIYEYNPRVGIIVGSSISPPKIHVLALDALRKKKRVQSISPYSVIKSMSSSISACLSTILKIYGVSYSISSACATSAHCIGNAVELIQLGKQDIIFAGGAEEFSWELACEFDAMGVLSTKYNFCPTRASRPFDVCRDGFVISEGAGILVLEELNHARLREVPIYAEIIGYGATSNGYNIVDSKELGVVRAMYESLKFININKIDYLNVHATSTRNGDIQELNAICRIFANDHMPYISATKSITGHALGAAGALEAIYTLLMLKNNFIAPSININNLDFFNKKLKIVTKMIKKNISIAMSNSLGFGGVNVSLVFKKF
ncbi:3-oxoacyl-[acyl-carrier-protein] synthase 1 [Buchnera aphidicola (Eriosoma grossulariae)]|uniref:beta-ketoacyl synthase N-terminal-like domain-containing protein n=1 Tax=Buchnera aphidicola TaxID=9 RepID=UPI0034641917